MRWFDYYYKNYLRHFGYFLEELVEYFLKFLQYLASILLHCVFFITVPIWIVPYLVWAMKKEDVRKKGE